jgi:catechol 2,3-dioxygenase-like lactoylglutathione lyase family enzyme
VTLAGASLVAFVATTDLDRSHGFYGGVLGLERIEASGFANAYPGLRVTLVKERVAEPYTVLGWSVTDLAAAMGELASRGVSFKRFPGMEQDEAGVWRAPGGSLIAWFEDPDANTLSLQQPPALHSEVPRRPQA